MSLAEVPKRSGRHVLVIAIGVHAIESAMLHQSLGRSHWVAGSMRQVDIDVGDAGSAAGAPLRAALQRLDGLVGDGLPVSEIRVMVADPWVAANSVPWSAALRRPQTARVHVRHQLRQAGFDVDEHDQVAWDDAPHEEPRLAVAYPEGLMSALKAMASRRNAILASVLTLSTMAWAWAARTSRAQRPERALAIVGEGGLQFVRGSGGRWPRMTDVTCRAGARGCTPGLPEVREGWRRLVLRHPSLAQLPVVDLVMLSSPGHQVLNDAHFARLSLPPAEGVSAALSLAGQRSNSRHPLDGVSGRSMPSMGGWLAMGVTALLMASALLQFVQAERSVQAMAQQQKAAMASPAKAETPPTAWRKDELPRIQAVNTAIRELNLPIGRLLKALEPPADIRVSVLSVEAQGSVVKIGAQAMTGTEMARYVAYVAERKPFIDAYLTRHEIDQNAGDRPYRFMMEASWKP